MNRIAILLSFFLALAQCRAAPPHEPAQGLPTDYSKAGTDGPHVFYKGGKIVVKTVVMEDSTPVARKAVYRTRQEVLLTCVVPETDDAFSFGLRDSISLAPSEWPAMPSKLLVLSDIEGNFKAFKTMLTGAKVMDERFNWTFGNGHLVLLGDFFDRGVHVTECLWLIYKLEQEAEAEGGAVHFILGNHEVMNLANDTRYTRNKYIENAELINEPYQDWFTSKTELGTWLYSKNALEKIGNTLFCHGGISPAISASRLQLDDINRIARRWYGKPTSTIKDPDAALVFDDKMGIFWYRDFARNKANKNDVTTALDKFGADRVIIGHTLVSDVTAYYKGKVVCVDLYHEENSRVGLMRTLYIEHGQLLELDSKGGRKSVVVVSQ